MSFLFNWSKIVHGEPPLDSGSWTLTPFDRSKIGTLDILAESPGSRVYVSSRLYVPGWTEAGDNAFAAKALFQFPTVRRSAQPTTLDRRSTQIHMAFFDFDGIAEYSDSLAERLKIAIFDGSMASQLRVVIKPDSRDVERVSVRWVRFSTFPPLGD